MNRFKSHRTSLEEYQARQTDKLGARHSPPTLDELRDMLHGLRWSYFNNFHIKKIGPFKFACGIGIYLGRSVAAIARQCRQPSTPQ